MDYMPEQPSLVEKAYTHDDIFAGGGEVGELMRQINWATTPLGPTENWPQSLRTALSICLLSRFPMLIWWGPELVMLYNDAYRPILGSVKHPHSMGQRGQECWPEIWDVIGPMLEGVIECGEATWSDNQLLLLERNGYPEEAYFTFSYSPIRDESGGIGGIFTAVTETTQQLLSQRRMRTLRELAAHSTQTKTVEEVCHAAINVLATNSADIPFVMLYLFEQDKQARLVCENGLPKGTNISPTQINLSAFDALSWPIATVIETGNAVIVDDLARRAADLRLTSFIGTPLQHALLLPITKAGQENLYGVLIVAASPMLALDADYRGFFDLVAGQIAANIADVLAYEEERNRAEALAALDRAKTTFFSNISHEFRTPLTLMLSPLEEALATPDITTQQREILELIYRNGLRLFKLVNTLLDFSRIESGRIEAIYEPTDLGAFTVDLASTFRTLIEHAGLRFIVACEPSTEPVYVARDMWEKIVFNLLSNAFKFTFEGQISVTLHQVDDHVELIVQDTGIGIAATDLSHIFERFHRVRSAQARSFEGSGIGLALVQELVQLQGGTISAASNPGQGTTFLVSLPLGTAHLPKERISQAMPHTTATQQAVPYIEEARRWLFTLPSAMSVSSETALPSSELPVLSQQTILLVDDNADMRSYLSHLLSDYYHVVAAEDGVSALSMVRAHQPDLIVSDIMMPQLDGIQLLRILRSDSETQSIPVLLLSARAGEEAAVEGLNAQADDYLVKPFSARELLARIKTRLEMTHIRTEIAAQAKQHAKHLQQLAEAALAINTLRPIEETLSLITVRAREIIGTHQAISIMPDEEHSIPITLASFSEDYIEWHENTADFDGSQLLNALHDHSMLQADAVNQPLSLQLTADMFETHPLAEIIRKSWRNLPGIHDMLIVPLQIRNQQRNGYLLLANKITGLLNEEDEAILVQLAQMASIAIENIRLYEEAKAAITGRDHLLSIVSHDLKNPLGAIKGYTQFLRFRLAREGSQQSCSSELLTTSLERIDSTTARMTKQVNELLDIAHLQLGQPLELSSQETDFVALVQQIVAEQQQLTTRHTLRVTAQDASLPMMLDAMRIERAITNVLSNAIKYSPQGQWIDITLGQCMQDQQKYAQLSIHDYGIGIPASEQSHIFEQFWRGSNVIGTIQGSGIGLASTYQIVKQHGGAITVESQQGEGTTFTIYLPIVNVAEA